MIFLSPLYTLLIAIAIPVSSVAITLLISKFAKCSQNERVRRFCSTIMKPSPFALLAKESCLSSIEYSSNLKRQITYRLGLMYFFIGLFLLSNVISVFYQVVADLGMYYIDPNFTPRCWSGIALESPFLGGWIGSFEWYGQSFLPPANANIFHETWSWIFFSAGLTTDTTFFFGAVRSVLVFTFIFSLLFLLPLAKRSIRQSVIPSLFFFCTGMAIATRGIFGLFGQALNLEFAHELLRYGVVVVSSGQLLVTSEFAIISILTPVVIALFIVFFIGARKLWMVHYPHKHSALNWFSVYIALQYWISLLLIAIK